MQRDGTARGRRQVDIGEGGAAAHEVREPPPE